MTGQTDIVNLALVSFLGSDHLMDRDEQDKNTRVMNLIYNPSSKNYSANMLGIFAPAASSLPR